MARFEVLVRSLVAGRIVEPGEVVEIDPNTMVASANLRPLDEDARAMRAERDERTAESAPPDSATANEMRRMTLAGSTPSEAEIQALYTYLRRST